MPDPVLSDYQAELGGLVFGHGTPVTYERILGADADHVRAADAPRPGEHGELLGKDHHPGKLVEFDNVMIQAATPAAALALKDDLADVWSNITDGGTVLRVKLPGQPTKKLVNGRPRRFFYDLSQLASGIITCQMQFKAADPRWYDADTTRTEQLAPNLGQYALPYAGKAATPVVIRMFGQMTDPGVIDDARVKVASYVGTIAAGNRVDYNPDVATVRRQDGVSVYPNVGVWTLRDVKPGTLLRLVATSPQAGSYAEVVYTDAWMVL